MGAFFLKLRNLKTKEMVKINKIQETHSSFAFSHRVVYTRVNFLQLITSPILFFSLFTTTQNFFKLYSDYSV